MAGMMAREPASANENVCPPAHGQFRLMPVPSPVLPAWNERVGRWIAA